MLRARFSDSLKAAMKAHDARAVSTLRMILSSLKNRDIAARDKGNMTGVDDAEIAQMLQGMVKQRRESMTLYEQGKRPELAAQEAEEIAIIETFLPKQLSDAELDQAVAAAIAATGAAVAGVTREARRPDGFRQGERGGEAAAAVVGPPALTSPALLRGERPCGRECRTPCDPPP